MTPIAEEDDDHEVSAGDSGVGSVGANANNNSNNSSISVGDNSQLEVDDKLVRQNGAVSTGS